MYRSAALRAVRTLLPEALPMLAGQWQNQKVNVWQQVQGKWTKFESERGGWQGSRLTQLAFCLSLQETLASVPMLREPKVTAIGVADDWYIVGHAQRIADGCPELENQLAARGHRLRRNKCKFWAPAADLCDTPMPDGTAEHPPPAGITTLSAIFPRTTGGCPLYTSDAADDLLCVDLGGRRIIKKKKFTIFCYTVSHLSLT